MVVVQASESINPEEKALLVVTKNGTHPHSTNEMLHRLFRGKEITKTFRKEQEKKKISDMFLQLWKGLGVPKSVCDDYVKQIKTVENIKHAFVVGLADPTCELPQGSVFITGLDHTGEIFLTRSPCVEFADGRMVPVVTSKPSDMSDANWKLLQSFQFGAVIFSNPKPGMTPMPVLTADGDLDGDLYFICWHKAILEHVKAEPMDQGIPYDNSKTAYENREDWFSSAQKLMADAQAPLLLHHIIGKLYNKQKTIAQELEDFMNDRDFRAYARAYKEALKLGKHGGKIPLPKRLHGQLEKFSSLLMDTEG
jgi:hypothetical protein